MANTILAILSCAIGFGAFVTGAFGMNLDQAVYLLPWHGGFVIIVVASVVAMIMIFVCIFLYFTYLGVFPHRQT